MKTDKQIAGYGLHYHANNQLVPNATDRLLLQCLIDIVRNQLSKSLDDQSIIGPVSNLARMSGLDAYRTIPGCIERLEKLGLIKKRKNAITVFCDEYVTLVKYYESLDNTAKKFFAKDFASRGLCILEDIQIEVVQGCRSELLGMSGSSISVERGNMCNLADISATEPQKCATLQIFDEPNLKNVQGCTSVPSDMCKDAHISTSEPEKTATLHIFQQPNPKNVQPCTCATLQKNLQAMAKNLQGCSFYMDFDQFCELFAPDSMGSEVFGFVKSAFLTGEVPNTFTFNLENMCNLAGFICATLQFFCQKYMQPCSTVIIGDNYKDKGETLKSETEENSQDDIKNFFENLGKVEVVDLSEPSVEPQENLEPVEDFSQAVLKRAERELVARNPYRKKPFMKVEKVKEIVDCLDEVVKSPVDFFLYQFWWGLLDLYGEHYRPSEKIDEEGEVVEEPQLSEWREMINAPLPQDEIYSLAKNVYEDLVGAVEQGRYVYGDNNEWGVRFAFSSFEDFNPYEIFQWKPCTMQDKSIPALRVAIDKFYDIEAPDVFVPTKGDKRIKNAQNRKMAELILEADDSQLTPMETVIKEFYRDFVVTGDGNVVDDFTDGKGTVLESGGGLPDHLLKPWCYGHREVRYDDLTSVLSSKYMPCDGIRKKAFIFSAEKVLEWNERHGYMGGVARMAVYDSAV